MNDHCENTHPGPGHGWMPRPPFRGFRIFGYLIGGILLAGLFALAFGYFVELLWNWLMPALFGLAAITFWQAFGLVLLAKILFSGFSGPRHHHDHWKKHYRRDWEKWGDEMKEWGQGWKEAWKDDKFIPKGSYRNWRYYGQYWKDEGKAAFEAYLDKMEKEKKKEE